MLKCLCHQGTSNDVCFRTKTIITILDFVNPWHLKVGQLELLYGSLYSCPPLTHGNHERPIDRRVRMHTSEIILDPSIRDWVVLPMVVVMVLVGLTRHFVSLLLKSEKAIDVKEVGLMYVRSSNTQDAVRSSSPQANPQTSSIVAFEWAISLTFGLQYAKGMLQGFVSSHGSIWSVALFLCERERTWTERSIAYQRTINGNESNDESKWNGRYDEDQHGVHGPEFVDDGLDQLLFCWIYAR